MSGWRTCKLKDVCDQITVGFVGTMAEHYRPTGVTFLRSLNIKPFRLNYEDLRFIDEGFHNKIRKSALRPGDVAVVRTGYPGTACVIPESLPDSNCSDLVIVRPSVLLNPHYLAAIFNSQFGKDLVGGNLVGAAQQHFNVTVAKELQLLIPPRGEQDKIAAILSAYDDLIANNQRRITLLERMAEDIYREWFVRLRFPGHENVKVEKGVPQGWELASLASLGTYLNGYAFDPTEWFEEGIPIIKIREMTSGITAETPRNPGQAIPSRYHFGNDEIIFSWSATLLVKIWDQGPGLLNQHLFKVTPANGVSKSFLFFSIKFSLPIFESLTTGSTMKHIKRKELETVKVMRPVPDLIERFDSVVEPILAQVLQLTKANRELIATRDALLPRLISGKLSVDALDIRFPPGMVDADA